MERKKKQTHHIHKKKPNQIFMIEVYLERPDIDHKQDYGKQVNQFCTIFMYQPETSDVILEIQDWKKIWEVLEKTRDFSILCAARSI